MSLIFFWLNFNRSRLKTSFELVIFNLCVSLAVTIEGNAVFESLILTSGFHQCKLLLAESYRLNYSLEKQYNKKG